MLLPPLLLLLPSLLLLPPPLLLLLLLLLLLRRRGGRALGGGRGGLRGDAFAAPGAQRGEPQRPGLGLRRGGQAGADAIGGLA